VASQERLKRRFVMGPEVAVEQVAVGHTAVLLSACHTPEVINNAL
jgi:hypothetical protein